MILAFQSGYVTMCTDHHRQDFVYVPYVDIFGRSLKGLENREVIKFSSFFLDYIALFPNHKEKKKRKKKTKTPPLPTIPTPSIRGPYYPPRYP